VCPGVISATSSLEMPDLKAIAKGLQNVANDVDPALDDPGRIVL
jgi:hypothetical protein